MAAVRQELLAEYGKCSRALEGDAVRLTTINQTRGLEKREYKLSILEFSNPQRLKNFFTV